MSAACGCMNHWDLHRWAFIHELGSNLEVGMTCCGSNCVCRRNPYRITIRIQPKGSSRTSRCSLSFMTPCIELSSTSECRIRLLVVFLDRAFGASVLADGARRCGLQTCRPCRASPVT